MVNQFFYAVLALVLAAILGTPAFATTTPRLSSEVTNGRLIWQGEAMSFEYSSGCRIDDYEWWPEVRCRLDGLTVKPGVQVKDVTPGRTPDNRQAKEEDLKVWVDGVPVSDPDEWRFSERLSDALEESSDNRITIAIPDEVGRVSWMSETREPKMRHFEYVLADYNAATDEYRQEVRAALNMMAREEKQTKIFIGVVALIAIAVILRLLIPASLRAFRSTRTKAYQKAHQARDSISRATYDYRVNREVERMRLQEEAGKRREVEREKEALNDQLQVSLEEEDHEKAQDILKQLADLKTKKVPGDGHEAKGPKE